MSAEQGRRWPLWLAVATGFTVSLLLHPPVGWISAQLEKWTGERLSLSGVQGSLWAGDGQLVLYDGETRRAIPGRLQWQIAPLAWFQAGRPVVTLQHSTLMQALTLTRTPEGLSISAGQLQFPATWLEAIGTPWNTLRPAGAIRLSWNGITIGRGFGFNLQWQDAQSALSVVKPLGNYDVLAQVGADGAMTATLSTRSGDLRLEGQAQWSAAQGFGFTGYASASPSQEVALTGLLSQMGRLENNNRYRLGS